jgi:hypothetical protein
VRLNKKSCKELLELVRRMDADAQDSLTRFYLRLLKEETWSYQLRKENLLLKKQSQEAYRKKLNKYVKMGFLERAKKYYVDGKPRNPFKPNLEIIKSIIGRYSLTKYEAEAAYATFKGMQKNNRWMGTLEDKLESAEKLRFLDTLFPLIFMGPEIPRFFMKLMFSTMSIQAGDEGDWTQTQATLSKIASNIRFNTSHAGIDHVGKRLFMDVYVKDIMTLLYPDDALEKHMDTMKIAVLEDITIPHLMPEKYPNTPEKEYLRFQAMKPEKRHDHIIDHIRQTPDHMIKDCYGPMWDRELAAYITYAIKTSIEDPRGDIRGLLRHMAKRHNLTREMVDEVGADIQRKIERHDLRTPE